MINRVSMNVDQVAGHLIKSGIAIKGIHRTEEPEVEDDAVQVTDTISVQVSSYGDCYMTVSRFESSGAFGECFVFYPERLSIADVVTDIKRAMEDE